LPIFGLMDPFSILGLSQDATDDQIKSAYRKLVKQHHPDRNPSGEQETIRAINSAYETLTDPAKRARYYQTFTITHEQVYQEEDPVEVYKREFKWRRWQREKREREEKIARQTDVIRVMRMINIAILLIAILLTIDRVLSSVIYKEQMLESRKESRAGRRTSEEYSFIRTANFEMYFAANMYVYFDSFATDTVMVTIEVSPLLKVPRRASYFHDNTTSSADVKKTIHEQSFLVTCIISFCLMNFGYRGHSPATYPLCFLPAVFFILFILVNVFD
jgi:DnaJ-domain-containing protein 1